MSESPPEFRYLPPSIDGPRGALACRYDDGARTYVEHIGVGANGSWPASADEAARLVHLMAAVSYYKATAAPIIDATRVETQPGDAEFLRHFVVEGLGEFAYRNDLDLTGIIVRDRFSDPAAPDPVADHPVPERPIASHRSGPRRPLIPFGGGTRLHRYGGVAD